VVIQDSAGIMMEANNQDKRCINHPGSRGFLKGGRFECEGFRTARKSWRL